MGKNRYSVERVQNIISENNLPLEIKSDPDLYKGNMGYFNGRKEMHLKCLNHGERILITPFDIQKQTKYKYKNCICPKCNAELGTLGNEISYNIVKNFIANLPKNPIHKFNNIISVELLTSEKEFNQQKLDNSSLWDSLELKLHVKQQVDAVKTREKTITIKWKEIKKDKHLITPCNKDSRTSLMALIFEWVFTELKVNHQVEYSMNKVMRNNSEIKDRLVNSGIKYQAMAYDFYLEDYNILIEIDGSQHYETDGRMTSTDAELDKSKQRDKLKTECSQIATGKPLIRLMNFYFKNRILKGLKHLVDYKSKRDDSVYYISFININEVLDIIGMANISFTKYIEIIESYNIQTMLKAKAERAITNRNSILESNGSNLRVIKPVFNKNKTESYIAQCQENKCKSFQVICNSGIYMGPPICCYVCTEREKIKKAIRTVENATCLSKTHEIGSGFLVCNKTEVLDHTKGFLRHGSTEGTALEKSKSNVGKQILIITHSSYPKVFIQKTIASVGRNIDYKRLFQRLRNASKILEKLTVESQKKVYDSQLAMLNIEDLKKVQLILKECSQRQVTRKHLSQYLVPLAQVQIHTKAQRRKG